MAIAINFKNVSHAYNQAPVLNNINCAIRENKITAVIGKSGGGKSTLLQMINGMIRPKSGEIEIFGKIIDYAKLVDLRLKIGYSVQGTGLFPHMTVFENIALLARVNNYDPDYIVSRTEKLIHFVDLDTSYLNKYPYQLSGGEQQRVGFCRAMILQPDIFLLDEAFGALDPTTRNELHREFLTVQEAEPRTVVMVTHDLPEAKKLAGELMVLHNGVIQQFGPTEEVLNNPANPFVRDFIQSQYSGHE
jgi:osmoprotectant transport system ATP-binding protein